MSASGFNGKDGDLRGTQHVGENDLRSTLRSYRKGGLKYVHGTCASALHFCFVLPTRKKPESAKKRIAP